MLLSSNRIEVMKLCKSIFFPNGVSYYGKMEDMLFAIGNFHNEQMGVTLEVNGRELPFDIGNYMEAFKLKDVRLYLLSKKMTTSSDESDDGLPPIIMSQDSTSSERACMAGTSTEDSKITVKAWLVQQNKGNYLKESTILSMKFHLKQISKKECPLKLQMPRLNTRRECKRQELQEFFQNPEQNLSL